MFISEEEASARISASTNLLSRASRDDSGPITDQSPEPPLPELDSSVSEPEVEVLPADSCLMPEREQKKAILRLLRGSAVGIDNLHPDVRAAIGAIHNMLGPGHSEEMFAVSEGHARRLKDGMVDRKQGVQADLLEKVQGYQEKVADAAFTRLLKTLDLLDDEKLEKLTGAKDLAQVASQISKILSNTVPKDKPQEGGTVFHIYRPEMVQETHYETVVVSKDAQ